MKQEYHSNANTNIHLRLELSKSNLTNSELAVKYNISEPTVSKWKNRESFEDKSSRPHTIHYALNDFERTLISSIRQSTWLPLDEVWEMVLIGNPSITRSVVYRTFVLSGINKVPEKEKDKAQKFKEYEPGYLHIDVTYLPKIDGIKYYLFVAIDRATRTLYYEIYDAKTSKNAEDFMNKCLNFFPVGITHVLTDNGLEFTNKLIKSKKGIYCQKPSKLDVLCADNNIEHRLTKPATPKTNGMVERANGTIKNNTIKRTEYTNKDEMQKGLIDFLMYYILYRRHGGLRKELKVKTPFEAIEKWFEIKPEIFLQTPLEFKNKVLALKNINQTSCHKQPCET
jgi:transposase-like protein